MSFANQPSACGSQIIKANSLFTLFADVARDGFTAVNKESQSITVRQDPNHPKFLDFLLWAHYAKEGEVPFFVTQLNGMAIPQTPRSFSYTYEQSGIHIVKTNTYPVFDFSDPRSETQVAKDLRQAITSEVNPYLTLPVGTLLPFGIHVQYEASSLGGYLHRWTSNSSDNQAQQVANLARTVPANPSIFKEPIAKLPKPQGLRINVPGLEDEEDAAQFLDDGVARVIAGTRNSQERGVEEKATYHLGQLGPSRVRLFIAHEGYTPKGIIDRIQSAYKGPVQVHNITI